MPGQILPSETTVEVLEILGGLLESRISGDPNDAYFEQSWTGLWHNLTQDGWTSFADGPSPGANGDFSLTDLAAIAELWGNHLVPLPLIPTLITRRWIKDRPDPSVPLSYALTEGDLGLIVHGQSANHILTGTKLVERSSLGAANDVDRFALSAPIAILGKKPEPLAENLRREIALLTAAESVGAAAMALQRTISYVLVREQFGRVIGSFQAVKHQLANLHIRLELSRSAITWGCNEPAAAAAATRAVFEHCLRVAEGCVQAHGGIGYTWAAPIHRYYRHVMVLRRVAAAAIWTH